MSGCWFVTCILTCISSSISFCTWNPVSLCNISDKLKAKGVHGNVHCQEHTISTPTIYYYMTGCPVSGCWRITDEGRIGQQWGNDHFPVFICPYRRHCPGPCFCTSAPSVVHGSSSYYTLSSWNTPNLHNSAFQKQLHKLGNSDPKWIKNSRWILE